MALLRKIIEDFSLHNYYALETDERMHKQTMEDKKLLRHKPLLKKREVKRAERELSVTSEWKDS